MQLNKFRAWYKPDNRFISFYECGFHMWENGQIYSGGMNITDRIILLPFTGFHDDSDNECELYKGSIVELDYESYKHVCEIKYEGCGFMFVSDSLPDGFIWVSEVIEFDNNYCWAKGTKLIGNNYENADLLQGV